MNELSKKWELCLEKIKDLLNDQIKYDTFYKSAKILDFNNGIVRIVVEMEFYQKVLNNDKDLILQVINKHFDEPCTDIIILHQDQLTQEEKQKPEPLVEIHSNL